MLLGIVTLKIMSCAARALYVACVVAMGAAFTAQADAAAAAAATYRNIVGFHLGPGGDHDNVETYLRDLDSAGIAFSIKDVDEWGPELALAAQVRCRRCAAPRGHSRHTRAAEPADRTAPALALALALAAS